MIPEPEVRVPDLEPVPEPILRHHYLAVRAERDEARQERDRAVAAAGVLRLALREAASWPIGPSSLGDAMLTVGVRKPFQDRWEAALADTTGERAAAVLQAAITRERIYADHIADLENGPKETRTERYKAGHPLRRKADDDLRRAVDTLDNSRPADG